MATKMQSYRFLTQNFLQTYGRALSSGDIYRDFCGFNPLSYLHKFFRKVELREIFDDFFLLLEDHR